MDQKQVIVAIAFAAMMVPSMAANNKNPKPVTIENQPTVEIGNTVGVDVLSLPDSTNSTIETSEIVIPYFGCTTATGGEPTSIRGCGSSFVFSTDVLVHAINVSAAPISGNGTSSPDATTGWCLAGVSINFTPNYVLTAVGKNGEASHAAMPLPTPIRFDAGEVLSMQTESRDSPACEGTVSAIAEAI